MKALLVVAAVICIGANGYSQIETLSENIRPKVKAAQAAQETTNVLYFEPRVITPEWSVVLATIKKVTPEPAEKLQIDQSGEVTISVRKVLFGKPLSEITLPYRYNNLAVFKIRDAEIRKRFAYSNYPQELVWPDLTILKEPYLLVVINPHACDPSVTTATKPTMLAAKVFEVSGEDDPQVVELLKQIPKK